MLGKNCIVAVALAAALATTMVCAYAFDDSKYPDLKGQWNRVGNPNWLQPRGPKPPLTPEYQAVFEANQADMAIGGTGGVPSAMCVPQGMPMMMNMYDPMEIVLTPAVTYILISHVNDSYRRIYTDGRDWPKNLDTTYAGYSIGKWVDENGDGKYNVLEVETRDIKGPRVFDATGLPLASDNQTVVKERFFLDKANPNILYDQITVFDHALTQPWTMTKKAERNLAPRPEWISQICTGQDNSLVRIGAETYFMNADGFLMPIKKNQPPPDLRFFKSSQK